MHVYRNYAAESNEHKKELKKYSKMHELEPCLKMLFWDLESPVNDISQKKEAEFCSFFITKT